MVKLLKKHNTTLVIVSVVFAICLGIYAPAFCLSIKFIGEVFINLLKLFALPLIASTLIVIIGNMGESATDLKSLMRGALSYMFVSEVMAVTIALLLFNLFTPGVGIDKNLILQGVEYKTTGSIHNVSIANFLLSIFPQNIFDSLAKFDLLPVVIFSTMFGLGCKYMQEEAKPLLKVCASVKSVSNLCLHGVMLLSPLGIFALVGAGVANASGNLSSTITALATFVSILLLGLCMQAFWQLSTVVILSKQSPWKILKTCIPMFCTAFGTSSSVATLPTAMNTADYLQSNPNVTRFMLPLCASINLGGLMMYEVAACLFFSQVLGVDLSFSQQLLIALASILCGMAEGGIPETSLVTFVVIFKVVNIPLNAISLLLPIDRILDRVRTMGNIFGNMCGTIIVSKFIARGKPEA